MNRVILSCFTYLLEKGWVGNTRTFSENPQLAWVLHLSNLVLLLQRVLDIVLLHTSDCHLPWRKKCILSDLEV